MSSLSVSNFIDITRSNDAPDSGSCHPDYIQFSPSSWAPHQVGNTAAFDLRRAHFTGLSAVTEPTSEQRNYFQTGEADSCTGGKRCTDELGGDRKCQGRPHHQGNNVKAPAPALTS
jgi:hypothetical protein